MKVKEAIILAGGLGTRLRSAVPELPKCMAPVNDIPFIDFVLAYLQKEGITKFIFSLGYKSEVIIQHLDEHYGSLNKSYVVEQEPLGTGGAIKLACTKATERNALIVNGDTLFDVNLSTLSSFHFNSQSHCSIALKEMKDFSRYGSIETNVDGAITMFKEKQYCSEGFINGGIYLLNIEAFNKIKISEVFSFEKDFLEQHIKQLHFFALPQNGYFIDIGIPEDYDAFKRHYLSFVQKIKQQVSPEWNMFAAFINSISKFLPA